MTQYVVSRVSDELYHYGIKGQKWGIRRFENEDGTLTEAGKKRYSGSKLYAKYEKEEKKLNKLYERTNQLGQAEKALKYDRKAKIAKRIGKAAAGIAVPAVAVGQLTNKDNQRKLRDMFADGSIEGFSDSKHLEFLRDEIRSHKSESMQDALERAITNADLRGRMGSLFNHYLPSAIESSKINPIANAVALGAGLAAVTAFGKSAYDRIKSNAARKYATESGHIKAIMRYKQQCDRMINMFKDTPYEELTKKSIGGQV